MLGTEDVILILLLVVIFFGEEKLPELARSLGKITGEFKNAQMRTEIGLRQLFKYKDMNKSKDTNEDIDKNTKIINLALEMGIDTQGKSLEQLIEEIRVKVKREKMWVKKIEV